MRPKDVILKAYAGEKTERVPVAFLGSGAWIYHNSGTPYGKVWLDPEKMAEVHVRVVEKFQPDTVWFGSECKNLLPALVLGAGLKFRAMGSPDVDECGHVGSEDDLSRLDFTRIASHPAVEALKEAFRITKHKLGDEYLVNMHGDAPFTIAAKLIGEEAMMRAIFKKPAFVERAVDLAAELLIHFFEPMVADGSNVDAIAIADPTASGDLISKKQYERFALPYLRKFVDWAKAKGIKIIYHICGYNTDRLDSFSMTGVSCLSVEPKTDIIKVKEILHGKMCIAGNIDPVKIMLQGTVREVETACNTVIQSAGTDGGFVLMPGCGMPPTTPDENVRKLVQVAKEWKF